MKSILGRGMDSCGSGYDLVAGIYEHDIKSLSPVKGGIRKAGVASILWTSMLEVIHNSDMLLSSSAFLRYFQMTASSFMTKSLLNLLSRKNS
jgi:hypothetical protein